MSIGDSYWSSEFAGNPDFSFPGASARRKRDFGESFYDQQASNLASDRDYYTELEKFDQPRRVAKFQDTMGGRGLGLSGLTVQGEGELSRQHQLNLGDIERRYARGMQDIQFGRQGSNIDYMDRLDAATLAAMNNIVTGEYDFFR